MPGVSAVQGTLLLCRSSTLKLCIISPGSPRLTPHFNLSKCDLNFPQHGAEADKNLRDQVLQLLASPAINTGLLTLPQPNQTGFYANAFLMFHVFQEQQRKKLIIQQKKMRESIQIIRIFYKTIRFFIKEVLEHWYLQRCSSSAREMTFTSVSVVCNDQPGQGDS